MNYKIAVIGDPGNTRLNGSTWPYSDKGWKYYVSTAAAQQAVSELARSYGTDLINLGDITYITGASTLWEDNTGRYINDFMAPYPAPKMLEEPYRQTVGEKVWPYDTYDYPNGYPNPTDGGPGGSKDGVNRHWPTPGNHDYGLRIDYAEGNVSTGPARGTEYWSNYYQYPGEPAGPSATAVPQPFVDYFGWLNDPSLVNNSESINIGLVDATGNSGIYYSAEIGERSNGKPLYEIFSIDTQRLAINAGYYGLTNGYGASFTEPTQNYDKSQRNVAYNPAAKFQRGTDSAAILTDNPKNGQQQLKWLEKALADSEAKWKIIIGHQPVYSSGKWGKTQPDDHMSNPWLQKFLDALPKNSFHAYYNGHSHYYQRVLEGNNRGIGRGIPFITLGNSGRSLYPINQTKYGDNVYDPSTAGMNATSYNNIVGSEQLPSAPTTVGVSAGYYSYYTKYPENTVEKDGVTTGAYGWGFGAGQLDAHDHYLLLNYGQTDVDDPAIVDNLNRITRNGDLKGWNNLTVSDWKPELEQGMSTVEAMEQTAQISVTLNPKGKISSVDVINGGMGYMASKNGTHKVDFEIRGNDAFNENNTNNPNQFAIATLKFKDGSLHKASMKNGGKGYLFALQAMQQTNEQPTESSEATIPINASMLEGWYGQPYTDYNDWYMLTDTKPEITASGEQGGEGTLHVRMVPRSSAATAYLDSAELTTGYSGDDQQQTFLAAQQGKVSIPGFGSTQIVDGLATFETDQLPQAGDVLKVNFKGDHQSSWQVNFLSSNRQAEVIFDTPLDRPLQRSTDLASTFNDCNSLDPLAEVVAVAAIV